MPILYILLGIFCIILQIMIISAILKIPQILKELKLLRKEVQRASQARRDEFTALYNAEQS